jgi:peptide/nickel transport system substrate-binding protein
MGGIPRLAAKNGGSEGSARQSAIHHQLDRVDVRRVVQGKKKHSLGQVTYLHWSLGQSKYYRACNSVYACDGPYSTTAGAEPIMAHNMQKAIQLLKESGYDGTPVVVLQITDRPFLNAAAVVTRQRLEQAGFKVILKAMDWSTYLVVRSRKEPPEKGGWNLLYT